MSIQENKVKTPKPEDEKAAPTTEHVRKVAHEAIDSAAVKAEDFEVKAREKTAEMQEKAGAGKAEVQQQFDEAFDKLENYIREKPITAAGMAFGVGVLATLIIRR